MTEDTQLDAFGGKSEATASAAEDNREATASAAEDNREAASVEATPPESTYAFSPDGAPCADCGESVVRRFRGEAGLVCADCKPWLV